MSSFTLIDTSAWIFALGPKPIVKIRERLEYLVEQNLAAVTSPILFELLSGVANSSDTQRLKVHLSSLHPFPFLTEEWIDAAEWIQSLRKKGMKVKSMDGLIAFKAIKHGLTVLHADADLDRLAKKCDIKIESYVDLVRRTVH